MGANRRNGPAASDSSEIHCAHCPVASDSSGAVGLVCGMKRGNSEDATTRGEVLHLDPTWHTESPYLSYLTLATALMRKL